MTVSGDNKKIDEIVGKVLRENLDLMIRFQNLSNVTGVSVDKYIENAIRDFLDTYEHYYENKY